MAQTPICVDQDELIHAYEMTETDGMVSFAAYVCRATGKIYVTSTEPEWTELEDIPEDIDDATRYFAVPDNHELGLDSRLVIDFAHAELPARAAEIADFFHRRGGYRKFKSFLRQHNLEQRWYTYRDTAMVEALRAWCEANNLQMVKAGG